MTIFVVASVIWLVLVYFVTVRVYEITEETLLKVRLMDKKLKWLKIEQLKKEK
jgi:hypothetical protein